MLWNFYPELRRSITREQWNILNNAELNLEVGRITEGAAHFIGKHIY